MTNNIFSGNLKTGTTLLLAAALATSCKKLIEIPPSPPNQIAQSQQFADSASVMTAVAAIYTYSSQGQAFGFSDALLTKSTALSADEIFIVNSTSGQEFFANSLTPLVNDVATLWKNPYSSLYTVHVIMEAIADNKNISDEMRTQLTGELKVVRALYYFNLVNLFGGVPLVTSTNYKATARLPRSSVEEIYASIISDLADASNVLKPEYPSSSRYRPNLYTALSLLAKVHLYRGEWKQAYDASNTVITSGVYDLEMDLNKVFLDGSNEAIWQIPANNSQTITAEARAFVPYSGTIPTYPITAVQMNAFEPGDQRFQDWIGSATVDQKTYNYPYKYKNANVGGANIEDYMIFRLGELYLIRAEAAAHLNNTEQALDDLKTVRHRAGLDPASAATPDEVLAAIMHERQTELFTEWGSRWFDLKRTGKATAVLGPEKPGWQDTDVLFPVPNSQRQLNILLSQNPGYN